MKLPDPLTPKEVALLEGSRGRLQSSHASFEAKLAIFSAATAAHATFERQHAAARRAGTFSAQQFAYLADQLALAQDKRQLAKQEMEAAREHAAVEIERASRLISKLCAPLKDQFRRELSAALQPFCTDFAAAVQAIEERHSALPTLHRFLNRGHHVSRIASAEEIERLTFELGRTLQTILDGGEIWTVSRVFADSPSEQRNTTTSPR